MICFKLTWHSWSIITLLTVTAWSTYFTVVAAGDVEWLKLASTSSSGPPPPVHMPQLQQPQPMPSDVDEQHRVQQMLLAMRSMPPAGSRWPAPPPVGHVPTMPPRAPPPMHPSIPHANHVAAPSADLAAEPSVCLPLLWQYFICNNALISYVTAFDLDGSYSYLWLKKFLCTEWPIGIVSQVIS